LQFPPDFKYSAPHDPSGQKNRTPGAGAGNFEKLEIAIHYGADAVYLGGRNFSLRNFSGNFTLNEMARAVSYAHEKNIKVYVAVNIYPRTHEERAIADFLEQVGDAGADAVIIADPGILVQARKIIPHIPVHISTQANTTSRQSALFWASLGASRINLARELTLEEIRTIATDSPLEIEAFVHGAMCMAYSGRCLLSSFLTQRDANRGQCAHPCRWRYAVVEELRPGQFMPLLEDDRGSYVFNSRDLCMIDHLPEMIQAGISSLKIEGRMKGIHYLATAVQVYRAAIDACYSAPESYAVSDDWRKSLAGITQRGYCTGFYLNDPESTLPNYETDKGDLLPRFVGKIVARIDQRQFEMAVRNKIMSTDTLEFLPVSGPARSMRIARLMTPDHKAIDVAQSDARVIIESESPADFQPNDILYKIIATPESTNDGCPHEAL